MWLEAMSSQRRCTAHNLLPTIFATMRPIQWAWQYGDANKLTIVTGGTYAWGAIPITDAPSARRPYQDIDGPGYADRSVSLSIFVNAVFAAADGHTG
jgi:hypothetical protein